MAQTHTITPANAVWVLVSFEGPDAYARVGGLGTRVTELGSALATLGFETHHVFLGDPSLAAEERTMDGRLVLHRWAQWLEPANGAGEGSVYDREAIKVADLAASLPAYLIDRVIRPAAGAGKWTIVLSEEWQTAACACVLADECRAAGLADRVAMFWNANEAHGLDRIDWARLSATNTITTVSHRVLGALQAKGASALVVPNGIPEQATHTVGRAPGILRSEFNGSRLLVKLSGADVAVGWSQALDAVALLRERRAPATLVAHCATPNVGDGVALLRDEARARGLFAVEVSDAPDIVARLTAIAHRRPHVAILCFPVGDQLARTLFAAADATLANAVSEPFGVADLGAMAAGGIVFTGGTRGDYAVSSRNAVVLETSVPHELAWRLDALADAPGAMLRIRRAARATARRYVWDAVIDRLIGRAEQPLLNRRPSRRATTSAVRPSGRIYDRIVVDSPARATSMSDRHIRGARSL